ncbi:(Dimethylallyl)adenosine tRNA methylthiotransferase MiaB [Gottschalkia acidurici 9a]|uniref:tRNA-2-methylthio-N(6)-dimethylallyladenosine synthase n=1 Tax=Gottschalkia acidurici (strain ATCC 7906 / DSM 604 / BCRC 14475 / CIP 104303 / KCTC 5404 / NCIMB 10678 / 9a) TaxID=1128398 RepID=K0AZ35_GOTA9|nr:tRNA (N6-isopentenyl adenosine(37)-C2)-methylthiotransferase MiaB [Gottschalkia acidurici]AFS78524.1 (Dimethylallyl)adenosine tRNA methylthiotransferase MiaB [Gottschalkia acidurici 9a]
MNEQNVANVEYKNVIGMYHVATWGCQANEHDSEKISGILESLGYLPANNRDEADIIIFNTCLIRENAELKVYGNLGELKSLKRQNPNLLIGICGCMMQKEEVRNLIKEKYRFVDLIFGTHNLHKLPDLISSNRKSTKTIVDVWEDGSDIIEGVPSKRKFDYKALVNITYGCNNFCTYCIVPYTRGRERSREPEDILKEIKELVKNNCEEVTLLGQNVNSYGKTLKEQISFAELLRMINEIDGLERIRFMTSHPKDLSDELIYAIRDCDKVCNHVHLPFQAGSNSILKAMNRRYTKEQYLSLVKKLKQEVPDISLTTDIIVGFPGETEEDFEDTLDVVKEVKFDSAYTFLYSIREGTPAATMDNQVPDDVKHNRFRRLLDTLNPIIYENNLKFKDTVQKILVEEASKSDESMLSGRTETSKLVHFKGEKDLIGSIVNVKIDTVKTWSLEGHIVEDEQ